MNKSEKKGTSFLEVRNVRSNIWTLNQRRFGPGVVLGFNLIQTSCEIFVIFLRNHKSSIFTISLFSGDKYSVLSTPNLNQRRVIVLSNGKLLGNVNALTIFSSAAVSCLIIKSYLS